MALVSFGRTMWPEYLSALASLSTTFGSNTVTFDSDTDRLTWVGKMPYTDTFNVLYLRTATVTTGCIIDVRLEQTTDGRPNGTLVAAGASASVTIADGDDNVWKTATIGTPPTINAETEFAIVITVDTAGATPNLQFAIQPSSFNNFGGLYPICLQDTGAGTWAFTAFAFEWIAELGSGVTPIDGLLPINGAATLTAFNSGSTDDEIAMRFQVAAPCRLVGARLFMANIAAAADFTVSLWPASSTTDGDALAQTSVDGDMAITTTADGPVTIPLAPVTLAVGTTYYLGLRADTANNISLGEITTATVTNALLALPGVTAQMYRSRRSWSAGSAGSWTDTTTSIPCINLIFDQFDNGAGGSGGGMRLAGPGGLAA